MFRKVVFGLGLVTLLAGFVSPLLASDQTFPIGLWCADPLNMWSDSVRMKKGFDLEWLAALRWQGINIGTAGNGEVPWLTFKLAKYDSVAFRIWLVAAPFHSSVTYPGRPQNQYLDITGRDPTVPVSQRYFTSYSGSNSNRDTSKFRDSLRFDAYLDTVVASVVDSVKNAHALWKYFYWDEPNDFHYKNYQNPNLKYWKNIWWGPDQSCSRTDSLGVHSWLKWKVEHRDSLHSVCINVACYGNDIGFTRNSAASLCTTKYQNLQGNIYPNRMQSMTYDVWPVWWNTPIGDTFSLRRYWTDYADTIVSAGKMANPADPVPIYDTQLQACGRKNGDTNTIRIPAPEEVRELANLAILHEDKGIFYFVLPTDTAGSLGGWAEFWDEKFVPFDAPYKDYVYQRAHTYYLSPNQLRPFNPSDPIHDPFRPLGQAPNPDSSQRGKEIYNLWKYAPYARNWNFLKTINDPLHIITPHLRNIWKVGQRITSVVADTAGGQFTKNPEYVTFADSVQGHNPTAFYAFIVNKDFNSTQRGFTVTVNGNGLPTPPSGRRYYVLDLNSRHLIPSTGNIVFHTVLKAGEGRLFRFIIGLPPSGGGMEPLAAIAAPNPYNGSMWSTLLVTDPDISFWKSTPSGANVQFTEGDTVVLQALVYNLGFSAKSDTVKFYIGDPLSGGTFLGKSYVTVPALSPDDTLPKYVTVTYNWVTNSSTPLGPKDINVFLKGASSSAHSLLWLNAEDYATKVQNNPWDMTEDPLNPDISSYAGFTSLTDSISGVWEGVTFTDITPYPELHFRITSPIDANKYKMLKFRVFSNQNDSVTVRWSPQMPPPSFPGMTFLSAGQWKEIAINLADYNWSGSVTDFYLKFDTPDSRKIRLAWAKLTTR